MPNGHVGNARVETVFNPAAGPRSFPANRVPIDEHWRSRFRAAGPLGQVSTFSYVKSLGVKKSALRLSQGAIIFDGSIRDEQVLAAAFMESPRSFYISCELFRLGFRHARARGGPTR